MKRAGKHAVTQDNELNKNTPFIIPAQFGIPVYLFDWIRQRNLEEKHHTEASSIEKTCLPRFIDRAYT